MLLLVPKRDYFRYAYSSFLCLDFLIALILVVDLIKSKWKNIAKKIHERQKKTSKNKATRKFIKKYEGRTNPNFDLFNNKLISPFLLIS